MKKLLVDSMSSNSSHSAHTMDSENALLMLCCTCLSRDRKLFQLCRLVEGVNNLYSLLSYDAEAYKEGFYKDAASLRICWECKAMLSRIALFRLQACSVQKLLTEIADGKTDIGLKTSLSKLKSTTKEGYDITISNFNDETTENFIDCGPAGATDDDDDVPLSELHHNRVSGDEQLPSGKSEIISNMAVPKPVLFRHKNVDKSTPSGYKCTECNKYFKSRSARWKHVQSAHRARAACERCGKRFSLRNNLLRHLRLHESPLPREQCEVCHKLVRCDLIKVHARIHTAREPFVCRACDKTFVSRASYEHHLKYTRAHALGDILKHKCPTCGKGYRSRGELRDHLNYQHRSLTSHQCAECGKALATRRCVARHVRRAHRGLKENAKDKICQQCGKAFRDKKGLAEHELIHSGERPLSCEVCGGRFRQRASLYAHRKRVHKIYPQKKCVQLLDSASSE